MAGLIDSLPLTSIDIPPPPEPEPSPGGPVVESYLAGPAIRLSPDGPRLLVTATSETTDPNAGSTSESFGWLATVSGDLSSEPVSAVEPLGPGVLDRLATCGWITWLGPDELLSTCAEGGATGKVKVTVRTMDLAGLETGGASFEYGDQVHVVEPLMDAANRLAYFWETGPHILHRLDLQTGEVAAIDVHPARGATPAIATPIPGVEPLTNLPPVWVDMFSDLILWSMPQLVAEPGGTRLYALGAVSNPVDGYGGWAPGSTGIWVFDTLTFANVDGWPAQAAYASLAITPDGRWLTAVGSPGHGCRGPAGRLGVVGHRPRRARRPPGAAGRQPRRRAGPEPALTGRRTAALRGDKPHLRCYSPHSLQRTRGVAAQHASLSRWRSPVRIRSGPPSIASTYAPSARPDGAFFAPCCHNRGGEAPPPCHRRRRAGDARRRRRGRRVLWIGRTVVETQRWRRARAVGIGSRGILVSGPIRATLGRGLAVVDADADDHRRRRDRAGDPVPDDTGADRP